MVEIVSVVNDMDVFNSCIKSNPHMNTYKLNICDNTKTNTPISIHYNEYIENNMPHDSWIIFCHQDFSFKEDISPYISKMNKSRIYGTVGVKKKKDFIALLKMDGWKVRKFRFGFFPNNALIGQFMQGDDKDGFIAGKWVDKEEEVETIDCCCIMVHSSLIQKYNLRFDPFMKWHLYSEEFSLNAKSKYDIPTYVIQLKSQHLGYGTINKDFYDTLEYLKNKYKQFTISTTCYDGHYDEFKNRL